MTLDTTYHEKRVSQDLGDPEYRAAYERARGEISESDCVVERVALPVPSPSTVKAPD